MEDQIIVEAGVVHFTDNDLTLLLKNRRSSHFVPSWVLYKIFLRKKKNVDLERIFHSTDRTSSRNFLLVLDQFPLVITSWYSRFVVQLSDLYSKLFSLSVWVNIGTCWSFFIMKKLNICRNLSNTVLHHIMYCWLQLFLTLSPPNKLSSVKFFLL